MTDIRIRKAKQGSKSNPLVLLTFGRPLVRVCVDSQQDARSIPTDQLRACFYAFLCRCSNEV